MIIAFLISIVLVFLVIPYLISGIVWYRRFTHRNRDIKVLADEFGLYFESGLPTFWTFIFRSFIYNLQVNRVEGDINKHQISIRDIFYPAFANLFNWGPPLVGLFTKDYNAGRRQTVIEIDGEDIKGTWKNFSLGNVFYLTPVNKLKDLLTQQTLH
jgi:hypothetical protein